MHNNLLLAQPSGGDKLYVEDVFSTWLYTGNGSTQTITNGIDLSGKGGLIWIKSRSSGAQDGRHQLFDTARGTNYRLFSDSSAGQGGPFTTLVTSVSNDSFSLGSSASVNYTGESFVSWVFRKQPKFFDCVTWTGNGSNRTISHGLGVVPGMIIVKRTDTTGDWQVYHRSLANTEYLVLNTTAAKATGTTRWNSTTPTATEFSLGTDATVNDSGGSYVAYLFAHDTTADGIVQCGSFTTDASGNATVNLGWEPQFLLYKPISTAGGWRIVDNMRGWPATGVNTAYLEPNTSAAESSMGSSLYPAALTNLGFVFNGLVTSANYIYLAIRRGPMRTPTDATKVFAPVIWTGNNTAGRNIETGFTLDLFFGQPRTQPGAVQTNTFYDRLRGFSSTAAGNSVYLRPLNTDAEGSVADYIYLPTMNGFSFGSVASGSNQYNNSSFTMVSWNFKRAPGFFDITCYSGTGVARTVSHNLGVAPELMIVKRRDTTGDWQVYAGASGEYLVLNTTAAKVSSNTDRWNNTAPTSTVFSLGTNAVVNASGGTYVAYLFATCAGISKVGTYTGTGTTKQIDCGFTNGARFVLIKRTDSTGDWTIWDTARGIVSGNDPYLLLNSIAAEVTNTDYIDPLSTGFEISSTAPAAINANGGTFVFLAIA